MSGEGVARRADPGDDDRRPPAHAGDGPRVEVAMRIDADGFFALLTDTVSSYS